MSTRAARTDRRQRISAAAAAILLPAVLVGPPTTAGADEDTPGVEVQELSPGADVEGVDTGMAVFIGEGSPATPDTAPIPISSVADFAQLVASPSAALDRAVTDYFGAGGTEGVIVLTEAEDGSAITGALGAAARSTNWDLLVAPALGQLPTGEWLATATAMAETAQQSHGVALLDPPADAVAAAPADGGAALVALAQQLRATGEDAGAATMYSSGVLVDASESPVATAPFAAGIIAATDASVGPWQAPGGPDHPIDGLAPALAVDNALAATLDDAGITPVMTLPTYGTVLMGARTLSQQPDEEYLSTVRTVGFVERSIELALQQYVFDANDDVTWSDVTAAVSKFLTGVWQEGGLAGATAADAFSVAVGVGSTMTAQDVLDGYMVVEVVVMVGGPDQPIVLTFTQEMQAT